MYRCGLHEVRLVCRRLHDIEGGLRHKSRDKHLIDSFRSFDFRQGGGLFTRWDP
jgi:hypothetical protein